MPSSVPTGLRLSWRRRVHWAGAVALVLVGQGVSAQLPSASLSAPAPASSLIFVIKGFQVNGANPLSGEDVSRVLNPYVGAGATIDTLQKATTALEAEFKAQGFALHRVTLPPQELGGMVTLEIVRFVIGKVSIEGRDRYSEANIRASVPELVEGAAPDFGALAVQTAIANESQSKHMQVALKQSGETDKIDARIVVKESKPWTLLVSLANAGSEATGNDRITLAGGHSNLFDLDHHLTAAFTTSIERSSDVRQFGFTYRVPLYRWGGVVGISYTNSDVLGDFGAFKTTGAGRTVGLNYNLYLPPVDGYKSFVNLGVENKQFEITEINGFALPGQAVRVSRPLTLGYSARVESAAAVWGYNADLAVNLPGGRGNDLASYQSEDSRISTSRWKALRGGANYSAGFARGWLWGLRGNFQVSPDALISGEQFGLGGFSSVRGAGERPISGDSGVLVSGEITTRELAPGLRFLSFVDAGWLANHDASVHKPRRDSLASVGLGVRYAASGFSVSLDYGHIVRGSAVAFVPGSALPQRGDEKLHLSLSARF